MDVICLELVNHSEHLGCDIWVTGEVINSIQTAEMKFLRSVKGWSKRDQHRNDGTGSPFSPESREFMFIVSDVLRIEIDRLPEELAFERTLFGRRSVRCPKKLSLIHI